MHHSKLLYIVKQSYLDEFITVRGIVTGGLAALKHQLKLAIDYFAHLKNFPNVDDDGVVAAMSGKKTATDLVVAELQKESSQNFLASFVPIMPLATLRTNKKPLPGGVM